MASGIACKKCTSVVSPGSAAMSNASTQLPSRPCPLALIEVYNILAYLGPKEREQIERTNKMFQEAVIFFNVNLCKELLGVDQAADLNALLPKGMSVKQCIEFLSQKIIDEKSYERVIGRVKKDPEGSIWKLNFLHMRNKSDPCNPQQTLGEAYNLVYFPDSFTSMKHNNPCLSGKGDLQNGSEDSQETNAAILEKLLTLSNLQKAYKDSSNFGIDAQIVRQYGKTQVLPCWLYVRKGLLEQNFYFEKHLDLAQHGIRRIELFHYMLYHLVSNKISNNANADSEKKQMAPGSEDISIAITNLPGSGDPVYCWLSPRYVDVRRMITSNIDDVDASNITPRVPVAISVEGPRRPVVTVGAVQGPATYGGSLGLGSNDDDGPAPVNDCVNE